MRENHQYFFHVGTKRRILRSSLLRLQSGIHGLTQALAKELAPSNIQVNAIAFGVIDTAMNQMLDPDERLALQDEIPAGRFAAPEEAAQMILHVLQAPSYMTGQIIGFDGGFL